MKKTANVIMLLLLTAVSARAAALSLFPLPEPECLNPSSQQFTMPFINQGYHTRVSWHLSAHKVPQAWKYSTGKNITVGVIDTGVMSEQDVFWQLFSTGLSSNRTFAAEKPPVETDVLKLPWHGTSVASVLAAPVTHTDTIAGVAYNANLIAYAVHDDPVIAHVGKFSAKLKKMADNPKVKIINISMGKAVADSALKSAIAYALGKGKLIFASAGVTKNLVIYPGNYDDMYGLFTVTGVEYRESDPRGKNLRIAKSPLFTNSYGSAVDFVAYVSRPSDGAGALTLHPSEACVSNGKGSSMAAPTIAGIAALVWSANPSLTRTEVVNILKKSSSLYPSKSDSFGYGIVDAEKALTLATAPVAKFVPFVFGGSVRLDAHESYDVDGGAIKKYHWDFGDGTPVYSDVLSSMMHYYSRSGVYSVKLTVTDDEGVMSKSNTQIVRICSPNGGPCPAM
ncbi:Subtilisin DY [Thalassocella blandensis]|nr:Subtilisin DY [Thalassocella blandensis]